MYFTIPYTTTIQVNYNLTSYNYNQYYNNGEYYLSFSTTSANNLGANNHDASGTSSFNVYAGEGVYIHAFIAAFYPGSYISQSVSLSWQLEPQQINTTTALTPSPNPSAFGQPTIFTAAVTPAAPGGGPPTGAVQFSIDGSPYGNPVSLTNGSAQITDAALSVGTHSITAAYSGDANYSGGTSLPITQMVAYTPAQTLTAYGLIKFPSLKKTANLMLQPTTPTLVQVRPLHSMFCTVIRILWQMSRHLTYSLVCRTPQPVLSARIFLLW